MTNFIQVSNLDNSITWRKDLTLDATEEVNRICFKSRPTCNRFSACLIPVRTNHWANFSKDFFFPLLFNEAIHVQETVQKIFLILAALFFDLLTLPLRFIACVPRVIYNAAAGKTVFFEYLKKEGIPKELLEKDILQVRLQRQRTNIYMPFVFDIFWQKSKHHFIEVPDYSKAHLVEVGIS